MNDTEVTKKVHSQDSVQEAVQLISAIQVSNMPTCVACGKPPKRLLNLIASDKSMIGFSLCQECLSMSVKEVIDLVAFSMLEPSTKQN